MEKRAGNKKKFEPRINAEIVIKGDLSDPVELAKNIPAAIEANKKLMKHIRNYKVKKEE